MLKKYFLIGLVKDDELRVLRIQKALGEDLLRPFLELLILKREGREQYDIGGPGAGRQG